MHILGGMLVGFFALAYTRSDMNLLQKLLWVIVWSIAIGILVEVAEWMLDYLFHLEVGFLMQPSNWDTITDIMHDFIGGIIAYCVAYIAKQV